MGEAKQRIGRHLALGEVNKERASGIAPDTVVIRLLAPRARFSLRLDSSLLAAAREVAGLTLDIPINRCVAAAERRAMRLGPDEWLLCGPEGETPQMARDVEAALAGRQFSLVDVGHRHVALAISGPRAADVLNSGCPLDLSPLAFPAGHATRTLLGKCEVILCKTDDVPTFEIECGRSFAAYVHDFLLEAAREFRAQP
jgi:sarcosine oxidase subunit gamma